MEQMYWIIYLKRARRTRAEKVLALITSQQMKRVKSQRRNLLLLRKRSVSKTLTIRLLSKELNGFVIIVVGMVILDLTATDCMVFLKLNPRLQFPRSSSLTRKCGES